MGRGGSSEGSSSGLGTEEAWNGGKEGVVAGGMLGRPGVGEEERD